MKKASFMLMFIKKQKGFNPLIHIIIDKHAGFTDKLINLK